MVERFRESAQEGYGESRPMLLASGVYPNLANNRTKRL
jgi:hypothetical protein